MASNHARVPLPVPSPHRVCLSVCQEEQQPPSLSLSTKRAPPRIAPLRHRLPAPRGNAPLYKLVRRWCHRRRTRWRLGNGRGPPKGGKDASSNHNPCAGSLASFNAATRRKEPKGPGSCRMAAAANVMLECFVSPSYAKSGGGSHSFSLCFSHLRKARRWLAFFYSSSSDARLSHSQFRQHPPTLDSNAPCTPYLEVSPTERSGTYCRVSMRRLELQWVGKGPRHLRRRRTAAFFLRGGVAAPVSAEGN